MLASVSTGKVNIITGEVYWYEEATFP